MMSVKHSRLFAGLFLFTAVLVALFPPSATAAWQLIATETGKRVEIDRESIVGEPSKTVTVTGRIVLDRVIVDPRSAESFRIIEVQNRFDCAERTQATLKRSYFKDGDILLRSEEIKTPMVMPVRTNTPDDRMLREACRPLAKDGALVPMQKTVAEIGEVSGDLRRANETLIAAAVQQDLQQLNARAKNASPVKRARSSIAERPKKPPKPKPDELAESFDEASREGACLSKHKSECRPCANGHYPSPIDLRDAIAVDLDPIQFDWGTPTFRVIDTRKNLQVALSGGEFRLLGKRYTLSKMSFRQPSETQINGQVFAMELQLEHQSDDGQKAILALLLQQGEENPIIQTVLNHLPLERGGEVAPPGRGLELTQLLPEDRRYFTFMGSLTTPPCTDEVLWLVLKEAQSISAEQLAIFQRLYTPNARPVQPVGERIVKESR